jgi:hypothetical protein
MNICKQSGVITPPATEAQQPWMTLAGLAFPIEFANNLLLLLALFLFND